MRKPQSASRGEILPRNLLLLKNADIIKLMIEEKYQIKIKSILKKRLGGEARFFIFGSSLEEGKFSDVDVAIDGEIENEKSIFMAKDDLEESDLPYKFDLVYLKKAEKSFRDKILTGKMLWLT